MTIMDLLSQCMEEVEANDKAFIEIPTREDIKIEPGHRHFLKLNNYRIQRNKDKLFLVRS